jgi:hypothetical protein
MAVPTIYAPPPVGATTEAPAILRPPEVFKDAGRMWQLDRRVPIRLATGGLLSSQQFGPRSPGDRPQPVVRIGVSSRPTALRPVEQSMDTADAVRFEETARTRRYPGPGGPWPGELPRSRATMFRPLPRPLLGATVTPGLGEPPQVGQPLTAPSMIWGVRS